MDLIDSLVSDAVAALPRGRRGSAKLAPTYLRDITVEDVPTIRDGRPVLQGPDRPLQKVRTTHHLAARLLAEGKATFEVAEITGYTPARVQQLQHDPTFADLVAHYKGQVRTKWLNVHERLAALGIAITEELQDRLDEAPESFSSEELRKWAETLLDRSGNGPSATRNVNVRSQNLTVSLIEQIKAESADGARVKLLQAAE